MTAHRLSRRLIFPIGAAGALWLARTIDVTVIDHAGRGHVLPLRRVWSLASAAVQQHAPAFDLLYVLAAGAAIIGVPLLLWVTARVTEGSFATPAEANTEPAWLPAVTWRTSLQPATGVWLLVGIAVFAAWWVLPLPPAVALRPTSVVGSDELSTFASIDHPFHAARAETVRRLLTHGRVPRWFSDHQGGYPAEFYPPGVAIGEVAVWAVLAGQVPLPFVHALVTVAIFIAPIIAFGWMGRRDQRGPTIAVAAALFHLALPGGPYQGGYRELVEWGMVTNVAAATLAFFSLVALDAWLTDGRRRNAVASALLAASVAWTNPRLLIAVACAAGALLIVSTRRGSARTAKARRPYWDLALVTAAAMLLSAVPLVSLVAYGNLYYFVHFSGYGTTGEYLQASVAAVSWPVFALAVVGAASTWYVPGHRLSQAAVITLALYAAATLFLERNPWIQQLETTRLMPFQRLLLLYLGGVGLQTVVRLSTPLLPGVPLRRFEMTELALVAAFFALCAGPLPTLRPQEKGMFRVPSTGTLQMADLAAALKPLPPSTGTATLVAGSALSTHQQLWAPALRPGMYFYDDWLWYWQRSHAGPYDPRTAHQYDPGRLAEVLQRSYFERHAIGAVAVSGAGRALAARTDGLHLLRRGLFYDTYTVPQPTSIVTLAGTVERLEVDAGAIEVDAESTGGTAVIRRNWFPRWHATVNGTTAAVSRRADGYMAVPLPPGHVRLEVRYDRTVLDRVAEGAMAAGLLLLAAMATVRSRPAHATIVAGTA